MIGVPAQARSEADDASRGSAVKLGAEVASRVLGFAIPLVLLSRLGAAGFGVFGELSVYALLLAETGELGLSALASRALVAGTLSLRSLLRARLVASGLVGAVALAAIPAAPALAELGTRVARRLFGSEHRYLLDGPALALLVAWFALSGWAEFLGVALRCRRARRQEAVLLVVLRASGLALVALALFGGAGLRGACAALALSPLPALALAAVLLGRTTAGAAPDRAVAVVLRESLPLAIHGALLLLSPRVEMLVMAWVWSGRPVVGLFYAALNVYWVLTMVPSAVCAGAMPALTREALRGAGPVRVRTAATLALLGVPAAVGLLLVAPSLARLLVAIGRGPVSGDFALAIRVMALAVPALFLNALVAASLIATSRTAWLPWLTACRVALAFALALLLVPAQAAVGAASGLVCAEWALLGLGWAACRRAGFGTPLLTPLVSAALACVPMALAVNGVRDDLPLAVAVGVLTWAATLGAALRLFPGRVRQLTGDLR